MLQSLFPKAHTKFRALPLLGPVADGFSDWLSANGYSAGSCKFAMRALPHADADLRKRGIRKVADLTRPVLYDSWRGLMQSVFRPAARRKMIEGRHECRSPRRWAKNGLD
jgi:hypothetical protein